MHSKDLLEIKRLADECVDPMRQSLAEAMTALRTASGSLKALTDYVIENVDDALKEIMASLDVGKNGDMIVTVDFSDGEWKGGLLQLNINKELESLAGEADFLRGGSKAELKALKRLHAQIGKAIEAAERSRKPDDAPSS